MRGDKVCVEKRQRSLYEDGGWRKDAREGVARGGWETEGWHWEGPAPMRHGGSPNSSK